MQNGFSDEKDARRLLTMATVLGAHGLKGALKMTGEAESDTIFRPGHTITLTTLSGHQQTHTIKAFKPFGRKTQLLFLEGITCREQADLLKGAKVRIRRTDLPTLEDGSYYWCDLIGLEVIDERQGSLGRLTSIMQTGAHDVYVVNGSKGETLIPVIKSIITKIDLEEGRIEVDLPDGL